MSRPSVFSYRPDLIRVLWLNPGGHKDYNAVIRFLNEDGEVMYQDKVADGEVAYLRQYFPAAFTQMELTPAGLAPA